MGVMLVWALTVLLSQRVPWCSGVGGGAGLSVPGFMSPDSPVIITLTPAGVGTPAWEPVKDRRHVTFRALVTLDSIHTLNTRLQLRLRYSRSQGTARSCWRRGAGGSEAPSQAQRLDAVSPPWERGCNLSRS